MKGKNKKRAFIAVLSVFAIGASGAALAGCNKTVGYIDAPERIEAELGTYVIPEYEVVDSNGMILAGYNVHLKSVTNQDGEEVTGIIGSAVTIDDAGIYSFVYSADSKKVSDVTVSIDFADRTAPTINYSDDLPKFFIKGNSYKMPSYTLSGDYDRSKCWAKVFHIAEDKTETPVTISSNRFTVDKSSGSYAIRIHVEDAAGNANDYEYTRKVDGPENVVANKVLYLDEQFGERQISCYQSDYTGGYVSKDEEGAHVYGDEQGAYKVQFDGVTQTKYNEGLLVMEVPAINDLTEYENVYLYVYNAGENDIIMGSQWWNDTSVKKGQWTKLTWNTREWGNNMSANNTKPVGVLDISGMTIRFVFDYGQTVIPNGTFYLSAMYGTPKVESELELGEHVDVTGGKHYINDVIELNAEEIDGKTVDYYKVDGEIIAGNSFILTKEHHKIEVFYLEGELTADNMTWAEPSELAPAGGDAQVQYMGTDENWAISYDVYGVEGWKYFGVYVGGSNQLLGFEISDATHSKLSGYGGAWKWMDGITLDSEIYELIRGATEAKPVKAIYVRRGAEIRVFLESEGVTRFIGAVEFSVFGVSGNNFGYGARYNKDNDLNPTVKNVQAVAGETRTNLYFEEFATELTIDGEKAEAKYYLGDTVTLTVGEAPAGKLFAYFKVNGKRLEGNTFRIPLLGTVVETVYTDPATLTLGEGISTADGKTESVTLPKDTYVTLEYRGEVPSGKYFIGLTVNGEEIVGYEICVTEDAVIGVLFGDKLQTNNEKLNDITDTSGVIYAENNDGGVKWNPASVEHVTNVMFTGDDAAVDEYSVLKIVTGTDGGENSFAFNTGVDNLDAYKEIFFYAYTEATGVKAGGWWCGDTNLAPGKWTKVTFGRNLNPTDIVDNGTASVWEAGMKKFAFRIMGAPAGVTVYVTAVYGTPYPDSTVTTAEGSEDYLTISAPANGTQYKVGETVTLTAADAPYSKIFAYFTANGEKIDGNTFVLTEEVEFGVVYNEISTITLGEGIKTVDGKTGTVQVARNVPVYLTVTDDTKYYEYFSVNGERISGNCFTPTEGKTYEVTAVILSREYSDGKQINSLEKSAMHSGEADLSYRAEILYNGRDSAVKESGALKITNANGGDIAIKSTQVTADALAMGLYREVYFYIYTEDDGVKAGTWWCNDTAAVKGAWTRVTVYQDASLNKNGNNPYDADGVSGKLFADASTAANFIYRIMGAEGKTVYITSLYGVVYSEVEVTVADNSKDNLEVSAPSKGDKYLQSEKVTLTLKGTVPEGKAFAYFTANGNPIEGNEYTLSGDVEFGVVFNEISKLTLGNGVEVVDKTPGEDGKVTVGQGSTVTLVYNGEIPTGKYHSGFKVDGVLLQGNTFAPTGSKHTVEAVLSDRIQTGNQKLTEISAVAEADLVYHANASWKPSSIEYVTDVKYNGSDGAVDEGGSLKVSLKGSKDGEQAFALKENKSLVESLELYTEIYFYIYADKDTNVSGVMVGGWWCRDVALVAGQWTKVSFTRAKAPQNVLAKSVWTENSIDEFVYSFGGVKQDAVVYVTAVYGVAYPDVEVTVKEEVKDYISFTGICKQGQTITLKHTGAPENQKFVCFTVNGQKYDKDTYTLGTEPVVIGAEFSEETAILTVVDGVKTADGETEYALGATVTLQVDEAKAPANKVFDRFEVDGKPIEGDTFVTKGTSHKVEAIFVDNAAAMTWKTAEPADPDGTISNWGAYKKLDSGANWVLTYDVTATNATTVNADIPNAWYAGVLFNESQIIGYQMGGHATAANFIGSAGTTWDKLSDSLNDYADILNSATEEAPVTLIFVRQGNSFSTYFKKGDTIYCAVKNRTHAAFADGYGFDFGFGWRVDIGGNPDIDNIQWVTGEGKVGLYLDTLKANISFTDASAEEESYRIGDTVTLIPAAAETGYKFLQFTVNGTPIPNFGNTFVVHSNQTYEVVAEYSEVSTLTFKTEGITTADGETEYARGAEVTLKIDRTIVPANSIVDYYTVDGNKIAGNTFVTTKAAHEVGVVLINGVDDITWETAAYAEPTETNSGGSYTKLGTANNWVLTYEVTATNATTVNADIPNAWYAGVLFNKSQIIGYQMGGHATAANFIGSAGTTWDKLSDSLNNYADILNSAPVTLIFIRQGNSFSTYFKKGNAIYCAVKNRTHAAFADEYGFDFGYGWRVGGDIGGNPDIDKIQWITGEEKVELYHKSLNTVDGPTSENQISNIAAATAKDSSTVSYVTDIPGALPSGINEKGVLKVVSAGNDTGLTPGYVFNSDSANYSEIYFYVYVEVDEGVTLSNVAGGFYWLGDTLLTANAWVKVTIDSAQIAKLSDGAKADLSKITLRVFSQTWAGEYTDMTGKTFYITSLYGVPKGVESMVENKATSYSVVSGNDELTAILNDNFFPDAE